MGTRTLLHNLTNNWRKVEEFSRFKIINVREQWYSLTIKSLARLPPTPQKKKQNSFETPNIHILEYIYEKFISFTFQSMEASYLSITNSPLCLDFASGSPRAKTSLALVRS